MTIFRRTQGYATAAAVLLLVVSAACRDGDGVVIRHLSFVGVHQIDEAALRTTLDTTPGSRLPWGEKRYFNRRQFDDDLKRIEAYYVDRGFPDARVTSYNASYSKDHQAIDLTITITEGDPIQISSVVYDGFDVVPEDHRRALERRAPIAVGHPLDVQQVEVARQLALDELRDHGYPTASVKADETPGSTPKTMAVRFVATPGPYMHFGPIVIAGNSTVGNDVIRRQLTYRPGQEYRLSGIQTSQRQLYNLELFQFAEIDAGAVDPATQEMTTKVTVVEGKHRRVTFGGGYGSEEHERATINWRHLNFLGGARTAGVEAKWSSLDRGVRLNFSQPVFLMSGLTAGASAQSWYANQPAYSLRTTGGRVNLVYQLRERNASADRRPRASLSLSFTHEYESYQVSDAALADPTFRPNLIGLGLNPVTGAGHGTLSAVTLEFNRSSIKNVLDAHQGLEVAAHIEQAATWLGGDFSYTEASVEARKFVPYGKAAVFALRVHAASIGSSGDPETSIPFFKRYFIGGSTSLRGWGLYEVSPLTPAGLPIGGFSLLESSLEARLFHGNFGVVAFVDSGNVWDRSWRLYVNDLRSDIGAGLRYLTPVGPMRFDYAWQLRPIAGLVVGSSAPGAYREWRVHFSIGQSF